MRVTPAEWDQQGRSVRGLPQSQHRRANVASTEILPLETVKSTTQSYVTFDNRAEDLPTGLGIQNPRVRKKMTGCWVRSLSHLTGSVIQEDWL